MIDLSGGWLHHPTTGYRDWRGAILAPFEWVSVALLRIHDTVSWVKSSAVDGQAVADVRLLISPPEQPIGTPVSFGIAGTVMRYNLPTMAPAVLSSMPSHVQLYPGRVFWLATALETVDLGIGGIIIRRDDTEIIRKGLWRLKSAANELSSSLRSMLARGRVGKIPIASLKDE